MASPLTRRDFIKISFTAGGALLLDPTSQVAAVIDMAAKKANWDGPLPNGQGRGIACQVYHQSAVAMVAEVSVDRRAALKVNRVVTAIDCGRVVHPDMVAQQMEGSIAFGLTTLLKGAITFDKGARAARELRLLSAFADE